MKLAVLVHHPCHGLGVGAHVGSGNISVWTQDVLDVLGIAAGNVVEFALAVFGGVNLNPTFGAPEWEVQQGGL